MKLALAGRGVSSMVTLDDALKSVGVRYSDVDVVDMSFPQMLAAFQSGGSMREYRPSPSSRSRSRTARR